MRISGYVNAVGRESRIMYNRERKKTFVETVQPKTFEKSLLKNSEVRLLFNHDPKRELGSTSDGVLKLHEDSIGLFADATITDPEVIEKARRKELRGWSFGFLDEKETWENTEEEPIRRSLTDIKLTEVSILDKIPAYVAMSIETRGKDCADIQEIRFLEDDTEIEEVEESEETKEADKTTVAIEEHRKYELELLKLKGE